MKHRCSKCNRLLNSRCFIFNKLYNELVCTRCDKKKGNNKWFIPKDKRTKNYYVTKYNFSEDEKKELNRRGRSWKQINGTLKYLRKQRWKNKKEFYDNMKKLKEKVKKDSENKKKLIKGLREYAKNN